MNITQGTTPNIVITIKNDMDLTTIKEVWVYISQQNKVKVDKLLPDVTIDAENKTISVRLEQDDTLALKEGEAFFQIRMLLNDDTALATAATKIGIVKVYKDGKIE